MKRQLRADDKENIISILVGWNCNKLTWDLLCKEVKLQLLLQISRQALDRHDDIKTAFEVRKKELRQGSSNEPVAELTVMEQKLLEINERQENEIATLKAINIEYALQFQRWAANADQHGLSLRILNQALPPVDRGASKIVKRDKRE
jgi:hypothetical protein